MPCSNNNHRVRYAIRIVFKIECERIGVLEPIVVPSSSYIVAARKHSAYTCRVTWASEQSFVEQSCRHEGCVHRPMYNLALVPQDAQDQ